MVFSISPLLDIITFLLFWMLNSRPPAALRLESVSIGSQAWLCSGALHRWGRNALRWGLILALCVVQRAVG